MRWMSACLMGGLVLSAYACGGDSKSSGDDGGGGGGDGGNGGSGGGTGGAASGGSGGAPGSGGSGGSTGGADGGTGGGSTNASTSTNGDSGGSAGSGGSVGSGGSSTNGGSGGTTPDIDCTEDADCESADMVCDPLPERCVECLFDSDCGGGEICDARTCVDAEECESSVDCEDVDGAEACDTVSGHCVECVSPSDCPDASDCVDSECRPYVECSNSLDCPTPQVCDSGAGRCVRCVTANDCDDGLSCLANTCRRACSSDNDCSALGLLCNFSYGVCARCVADSDCPEAYNCSAVEGRCVLDTCRQGSGYCEGNSLSACNASGSAYESQVCGSSQTCVEGEEASCQDWTCTPGAVECNAGSTAVITCSADGLSIEASTDCTADDEICYQAECQALDCAPFSYFCKDHAVHYCYSDGLSSTETDPCTDLEFCLAEGDSASCVPLLCTPDEPACNGNVATECNAEGDGYVSGGSDCGDSDEYCVDGACQELECDPSSYFCEDNVLRNCAYDGLSSSVWLACSDTEMCDAEALDCVPLLCAPGEPACNGKVATTCNSAGDGYLAGGIDCADTDEYCVDGDCQECNGSVLLLGDDDTVGNAIMEAGLESAGMAVTRIDSGVVSYAGTPDAADFGAVVASIGGLWSSAMTTAGQDSIAAAHAAGTGYLTNEYASYQHTSLGLNPAISHLQLLAYATNVSSISPLITLTASGHPIWDGLPTSFTPTITNSYTYGPIINSGVSIATCSGCDSGGTYPGAFVVVREGTGGRLVHLGHAGNVYDAYTEANLLKMFVNAAQWAAGCK